MTPAFRDYLSLPTGELTEMPAVSPAQPDDRVVFFGSVREWMRHQVSLVYARTNFMPNEDLWESRWFQTFLRLDGPA